MAVMTGLGEVVDCAALVMREVVVTVGWMVGIAVAMARVGEMEVRVMMEEMMNDGGAEKAMAIMTGLGEVVDCAAAVMREVVVTVGWMVGMAVAMARVEMMEVGVMMEEMMNDGGADRATAMVTVLGEVVDCAAAKVVVENWRWWYGW